MTPTQVNDSISTGELKLTKGKSFSHYTMVWILFAIPLCFIVINVIYFILGKPKPLIEDEVWIYIVPPIPGVICYKIQKNRLKFEVIETDLTRTELNVIIGKVAEKLEWEFNTENENVIVATTFPSLLSGSWGERITILFDNNRVFINSICDPDKQSSMVSMGRNKKNVNTLVEEIRKASC